MTRRVLSVVRRQSLGFVALLVALSGTAYAAGLPRNSVGSVQLKTGAVKTVDVKDGSLLAGDFKAGQLPAGAQGPQGIQGPQGTQGARGPAALRLSWRGQIGAPDKQFGTIGPWSISASCTANGPGGARTALWVAGNASEDVVQIHAVDSKNDGPATTFQTGAAFTSSPHAIMAGDSGSTGYGRQSGTAVLDDVTSLTGSIAVDLLGFAPGYFPGSPGDCWVTGTVTLAETP